MNHIITKAFPHRYKIAIPLAFLCLSISSMSIVHAAITDVVLTDAPIFDVDEGESVASVDTTKGLVLLSFKHPHSAVSQKLALAKIGSCVSLGTKDALIVKGKTVDYAQYLKSVAPCKKGVNHG